MEIHGARRFQGEERVWSLAGGNLFGDFIIRPGCPGACSYFTALAKTFLNNSNNHPCVNEYVGSLQSIKTL